MHKVALITMVFLILLLSNVVPVMAAGSVTFELSPDTTQVKSGDTVAMTLSIQSGISVAVIDLIIEYDEAVLDCVTYRGIAPLVSESEIFTDEKRGDHGLHLIYLDSEGGNSGIKNGDFFFVKFMINQGYEGETVTINVKVVTAGDANAGSLNATGDSSKIQISAGSAVQSSSENTLPQPSETTSSDSTQLAVAEEVTPALTTTTQVSESSSTTATQVSKPNSTTTANTEKNPTEPTSQATQSPEPSPIETDSTAAQPEIWVPVVAAIAAADAGIIVYILKRRRLRK